jgi:hypothetical protein
MDYSTDGDVSSIQFAQDYNYLVPIVSQDGGSEAVRLAFDVQAFPTLILVGPNNVIVSDVLYAGPGNTLPTIQAEFLNQGIGEYPCTVDGCTDQSACNYNPEANNDDGSCDFSCYGCTDPSALNYDPAATIDDDSCYYLSCDTSNQVDWSLYGTGIYPSESEMDYGLVNSNDIILNISDIYTEPSSQNTYDVISFSLEIVTGFPQLLEYSVNGVPNSTVTAVVGEQICVNLAGIPVNSGVFDVLLSGTITLDIFGNSFDVEAEFLHQLTIDPPLGDILGCTYNSAVNFNPVATIEDGSCVFEGCTDVLALNFDIQATIDDGSCLYAEQYCGPGTYWDEQLQQCAVVEDCPGDMNNDGEVSTTDLLMMLGFYGTDCN